VKNIRFLKTLSLFLLSLALICCQAGKRESKNYNLSDTGTSLNVERAKAEPSFSITAINKNAQAQMTEMPVDLPDNYKKREFIASVSEYSYDINYLPGNIIKYNPAEGDYKIVSLTRFIKENENPEIALITDQDGLIFKSIIKSSTSISGRIFLPTLSLDKSKVAELAIQDICKSVILDKAVAKEEIAKAITGKPQDELANYFYIKGAVLTIISYRIFNERKFSAGVDCTYITLGGKVYGSQESMSRERRVSLELVALANYL
jgi:hypothetical protein